MFIVVIVVILFKFMFIIQAKQLISFLNQIEHILEETLTLLARDPYTI